MFAYYSGYFPENVADRIKSTNTIKFNDNGEYIEITTGGDGKKLLNPTGKKLLNPTRKKLLNPTRKKKSLSFFKKKTLQQKGGGNTGNLTLENCIYLKEATERLKGNQHDPALLSLTFSEIQYQSRVKPELYPILLLKFGGYIGDDDNELLLRASEREREIRERSERDQRAPSFSVSAAGPVRRGRHKRPTPYDRSPTNRRSRDYDKKVNISKDKANEIMKDMNIIASEKLHIANVNNLEEILSLMDTYIKQFGNLSSGIHTRQDNDNVELPKNFRVQIAAIDIPNILEATSNKYKQSYEALNFNGKTVYYRQQPFTVKSVNHNNTFTLIDKNDTILNVNIYDRNIIISHEQIISVNYYINIHLNNLRDTIVYYKNEEQQNEQQPFKVVSVNQDTFTLRDKNGNLLNVHIYDPNIEIHYDPNIEIKLNNLLNKIVYYTNEQQPNEKQPVTVVSVNQDTFTLRDKNGILLNVPIYTNIGIPNGQYITSVNDYINIQLNNFGYYYNYISGVFLRIEDAGKATFLNMLFSLWSTNETMTHNGGDKKAKKTKKKRKIKKHTKKIKYRKKKSKSKTIRKKNKRK